MLEDRHYMRRPGFGWSWSATTVLLAINAGVFVVQSIIEAFSSFPTNRWFALSLWGLEHGYLWQLLTYQFMHGGLLHLLLNCWAIFVFGREVENTLGRNSFLALYISSGVIGGLFQALGGVLFRGTFAAVPVVGASACAFGLVAAFATLYPEQPLMMLVYLIIPVRMRAKFLLLISGLLALAGLAFPGLLGFLGLGRNIAHAAHLGGMVTGILFVRYAIHWRWRWPRFRHSRTQTLRPLVHARSRTQKLWSQMQGGREADLPPDQFVSKEVDPILDKISAHGIQSLTERERRILETAREKMVRR
jgi:membrane associated rhomboid family serine protease